MKQTKGTKNPKIIGEELTKVKKKICSPQTHKAQNSYYLASFRNRLSAIALVGS